MRKEVINNVNPSGTYYHSIYKSARHVQSVVLISIELKISPYFDETFLPLFLLFSILDLLGKFFGMHHAFIYV